MLRISGGLQMPGLAGVSTSIPRVLNSGMAVSGDLSPKRPQHYRRNDWIGSALRDLANSSCDLSYAVSGVWPEQRDQHDGPDESPEQPCDRWMTRLPFQNLLVQHFCSSSID